MCIAVTYKKGFLFWKDIRLWFFLWRRGYDNIRKLPFLLFNGGKLNAVEQQRTGLYCTFAMAVPKFRKDLLVISVNLD